VELEVDGWRWTGDVTLVAVANGPCYGGGMRIAPGAVMDDGLLDVCLVRQVGRATLLRQLPGVFRGKHIGHARVVLRRGSTVTLRTERAREIYADGEPAGCTPAVCSMGAARLQVLVPGKEIQCPRTD
jgi:diacylglycerol kinase (ATP)